MSDHTPPPDTSVKVAHLVFGLVFAGVVGLWALVVTDVITTERLPVLFPALLIVAGVVGLAASLASSRNRRRRHDALTQDRDAHVTGSTTEEPLLDRFEDAGTEPTQELR